MKYKVGDKVKVRNDLVLGRRYGGDKFIAQMELFKGTIVTIAININDKYSIKEDDGNWNWTDEMFESNLISLVDLSEIEPKPKEVVHKGVRYSLTMFGYYESINFDLLQNQIKFKNFNKPLIEILEEKILDDVEKKYLSLVNKPFKNNVKYIVKHNIKRNNSEFIVIRLKNDECIGFPYFRKNTMYKGMELGKEYTLEELGL